MLVAGSLESAVIYADEPISLPKGTMAQTDAMRVKSQQMKPQGGTWKRHVVIAEDLGSRRNEIAVRFELRREWNTPRRV